MIVVIGLKIVIVLVNFSPVAELLETSGKETSKVIMPSNARNSRY